jgi:hypothetical protein
LASGDNEAFTTCRPIHASLVHVDDVGWGDVTNAGFFEVLEISGS